MQDPTIYQQEIADTINETYRVEPSITMISHLFKKWGMKKKVVCYMLTAFQSYSY